MLYLYFFYCAQNDTRAGLMFLSLSYQILSIDETCL